MWVFVVGITFCIFFFRIKNFKSKVNKRTIIALHLLRLLQGFAESICESSLQN